MAAAQVCSRPHGSDICPFHPENKVIFECVDCIGTLVCSKCIIADHNRHEFREIKTAVKEKMEKIISFIENAKQGSLQELVEEMEVTKKRLEENNLAFEDEITQVKQHGENMKAEVDLDTNRKVSRLQFLLKLNKKMLQKHQSVLEKLQTQLQEKIHELQQTLKTGTDVFVYDTETKVEQTSLCKVPSIPAIVTCVFNPFRDYKSLIHKALGDIEEKVFSRTTVKFLDQPKTLYENNANIKLWANGICPTTNNMAWIGYPLSPSKDKKQTRICLVDSKGSVIRTLGLNVCVYDISTHPISGELYCSSHDRTIRRVNIKNGKTTVMLIMEEQPLGLACMENDNFVVSFEDEESVKVGMYERNGNLLYTQTVLGNSEADVLVCPKTNYTAVLLGLGGLEVLNDTLQKVYAYTGADAVGGGRCNFSTGVFADGCLLIGDQSNKMIHILHAETGECVKTLQTDDMSRVMVLGVQQDGVLWVGCKDPDKLLCIKYLE